MIHDEILQYLDIDEHGQWYDRSVHFIGMMSGTSLDALDLALCCFEDEKPVLVATHSAPFAPLLHQALLALTTPNGVSEFIQKNALDFQSELDVFGWASAEYAKFAAVLVQELLQKANIPAEAIGAIGCHGQTVRHRPQWGFSLQLVDPNILAEQTGIAVVSDFRRRDMAVGGQGAPLIPAFHQAMFGSDNAQTDQTVVLNLGGIANITVLGARVLGYDTGVANLLMDGWAMRHLQVAYDKDGAWAQSGQVHEALLQKLLAHPFLQKSAPKSTGREEFHLSWLDTVLQTLPPIFAQDVQATLCEFTAQTAAAEISPYQRTQNTLYVCGGGAYNRYLLTRLQYHLPAWRIYTTDHIGISPSWIEAMGFAWLAQQTILGNPANLPAVTGAHKAVVLGQVCFG